MTFFVIIDRPALLNCFICNIIIITIGFDIDICSLCKKKYLKRILATMLLNYYLVIMNLHALKCKLIVVVIVIDDDRKKRWKRKQKKKDWQDKEKYTNIVTYYIII